MKSKPDLSDIAQRASNDSLRELTVRHVKAGYSNVYKYAIALEAERDALLAVVDMAIAYEQTLAPFGSADEGFYHVGDEIALDNFQDAITALPENLKGENDE